MTARIVQLFAARRRPATSPGARRSEAASAPARPLRAGATIVTRQDALNVIACGLLPMYGADETRRIIDLADFWPLDPQHVADAVVRALEVAS